MTMLNTQDNSSGEWQPDLPLPAAPPAPLSEPLFSVMQVELPSRRWLIQASQADHPPLAATQ